MEENPLARLSPREMDCLRLAADLRGSKDIGARLGITEGTVNGYINDAMRKLGANNRNDAARIFRENATTPSPIKSGARISRVVQADAHQPMMLAGGGARQSIPDIDAWSGAAQTETTQASGSGGRTGRFHILRGERQRNDLSKTQRLMWMAVASVVAIVIFASSAFVIDSLTRLAVAIRR